MNVTDCTKSRKKLEKKSTRNGIGKRTRSCEDDYLKYMEMGLKLCMVSAHQINYLLFNFFHFFFFFWCFLLRVLFVSLDISLISYCLKLSYNIDTSTESAESAFCKYNFENKSNQKQVLVLVPLMQGGSFLHRVTVWMVLKEDAYPFILLAMKNA